MESVRTQLKDTAQLARSSGWPERELLHQRSLLGVDKRLELAVEFGELGMVLDIVQRLMVALVALVLPDVHYIKNQSTSMSSSSIRNLPNVSQSPTSVLQLPTK